MSKFRLKGTAGPVSNETWTLDQRMLIGSDFECTIRVDNEAIAPRHAQLEVSEDSIKQRLDQWGIDQIFIFYLVIGAIYWLTMSRVVRGQVKSLKNEQFVEAARTIDSRTWTCSSGGMNWSFASGHRSGTFRFRSAWRGASRSARR